MELDPAFASIYFNRGLAHYDSGNLEQAIEDFTKAIELAPEDERNYFNRGLAYYDSGNPEMAVRDFERYLELAPADASNLQEVIRMIDQLRPELLP